MRLAIDDVGAGYSSLRHIMLTAPDVIKLDRSIVAGVAGDRVRRTLVASLVGFAHGSGATVVAEGIETAADAAACDGLRVDHGQGWFFGRPGPASGLEPIVQQVVDLAPRPGAPRPRAEPAEAPARPASARHTGVPTQAASEPRIAREA